MAKLIKTDGTEKEVFPQGKKFTCKEVAELIGADLIEQVTLRVEGGRQYMLCDEEGAIKSGAIANPKASKIFCENFPYDVPEIFGDVIICNTNEF